MGVEDTYDAIAETYGERFWDELDRKPFDRDLLGGLAARLTGTVADLGCGPGHVGRYLFDRGVDVIGIDLSAAMIRVAQRRNPGMQFEKADMRALPFDDDALGGAVAFYSLIHLEDLGDALRELHRVIRPDGVLCVAVHAGTERVHLDEWFDQQVDIDARFWTSDEVTTALRDAGFTVESAVERDPYEGERTQRLYVVAIS